MTNPAPSIHRRPLDLPNTCDICGRARNHGNHQRCSEQRAAKRRAQQ